VVKTARKDADFGVEYLINQTMLPIDPA